MRTITATADYLAAAMEAMGFILMSQKGGRGLPLVAFRFDPSRMEGKSFDEFALAHQLRSRGWIVPAYTMAPHTDGLKMLRVVVREDLSRSRCDQLIIDIQLCLKALEQMSQDEIQRL